LFCAASQEEKVMRALLLPRVGAILAAAFIASAAPAALATASPLNALPAKNELIASNSPFEPAKTGAAEAWCNSLAYPYCEDPSPAGAGVGSVPYADPMPVHPLFGK
jgi:hypothetical protein